MADERPRQIWCACGEPDPCFVHEAQEHHAMKMRLKTYCECALCRRAPEQES